MKLRLLWPLAFGLFLFITVSSCTKTVVGPGTTTIDTLRDTLRDSLHDTLGAGHAWIRFVSLFPDSITTTIFLSTTPDANSSLFTVATNSCGGAYFPIRADTSYLFYLSSPTMPGWFDSLPIPVLGSTVNTYALFLESGAARPSRSIDSEKLTPPPNGYCYVRFMNGIPDGAAQFNFDLDTVGNSLFKVNGHSLAIAFRDITHYALVPASTNHTILLRIPGSLETPLEKTENFQQGFYYTVRATGSLSEHNAQIQIDQE